MSMKIGSIETNYGEAEILACHYGGPDGPTAVRLDLTDGEIFGVLTVNLPDKEHLLGRGEVFVKTWSENAGWVAKVLATGLFEDTGKRVPTGFVEAQIWRFVTPPGWAA